MVTSAKKAAFSVQALPGGSVGGVSGVGVGWVASCVAAGASVGVASWVGSAIAVSVGASVGGVSSVGVGWDSIGTISGEAVGPIF